MHCLYCDRPLALLKRLTGDGEFCSKEHRRIYQQEHNQLALARLLEAQPASKARTEKSKTVNAPAAPATPPELRHEKQPEPAGFLAENVDAILTEKTSWITGSPRFEIGAPVWEGFSQTQQPGPGPKTAVFVTKSPEPRITPAEIRKLDKSAWQAAPGILALEGSARVRPAASRCRPAGAGFVFEKTTWQ